MKVRLSKKDRYRLMHCPLCHGLLEDYELVFHTPSCYCPSCDILKMELMSLPWLCSKCDSKLYVHPSDVMKKGGSQCFLCLSKMRGIEISTFHNYLKKGKIKRGYFVSDGGIPRKYLRNHNPEHKVNKTLKRWNGHIFVGECTECDYRAFVSVPEWRQKELGIQKKDTLTVEK